MDDCSTPKTYDVFAGPYPIETLGLFTALCDANWPIDAALTAIEQKTAERRAPTTDNVIDLAAYTAKTAEAVVIAPDGEPLFNERDTEALDRHSKAAGYAYDWRDASGHGLTVRAVIEVGRNWAACKRIAKDAFKDWFEYTGG